MHDVDTSAVPSAMMDSRRDNSPPVISSLSDLERAFPEYAGTAALTPSRAGVPEDSEPDWEQDTYEVEQSVVLARLLNSFEECVIVVPTTEAGYTALEPLDPRPFGNAVVGTVVEWHEQDNEQCVTIENPRYMVVLYSAALLVTQYEMELSNRVLHGVRDQLVDAVNRKYTKNKRE